MGSATTLEALYSSLVWPCSKHARRNKKTKHINIHISWFSINQLAFFRECYALICYRKKFRVRNLIVKYTLFLLNVKWGVLRATLKLSVLISFKKGLIFFLTAIFIVRWPFLVPTLLSDSNDRRWTDQVTEVRILGNQCWICRFLCDNHNKSTVWRGFLQFVVLPSF